MFTFIAGIKLRGLTNSRYKIFNCKQWRAFWVGSLDCIYDDSYISKTGIETSCTSCSYKVDL